MFAKTFSAADMASAFFPHVNLAALRTFATSTAATEHPRRNASRRGGRAPERVQPRISSFEDVVWAGEKMILITFEQSTIPLGPSCMLAHFPRGRKRLTTQALVGMTTTIRSYGPVPIGAPKVYAYMDNTPNPVGAEVALLEKIPGDNLEDVWPTLTPGQAFNVCVRLSELLLALFNYRGSLICTDLVGTNVNTRPPPANTQPYYSEQAPVLLSRPFDEGPLITMDPQPALESNEDYLNALARRIERLFSTTPAGTPTPENSAARDTGFASNNLLTDEGVERVKETWKRLSTLIPHHTGGFYIPATLSPEARRTAYSVLNSRQFGILHSDMQMSRFIVQFYPAQDADGKTVEEVRLTLTGWEHAHRAPLWSCARFPPWLQPRLIPNEVLTWERQVYFRDLIVTTIMNDTRMLQASWHWIVAYVFGQTERWFEGCLSSHWMYRDSIEVLLSRLKAVWAVERPDIRFPLMVGRDYLGPGETRQATPRRQEDADLAGAVRQLGDPTGAADDQRRRREIS